MTQQRRKSDRFKSRKSNQRKERNYFKIIKEFDADESGKVEFKEFVRVMAKKAENAKIMEKEEEFRKAFEVIGNSQLFSLCQSPLLYVTKYFEDV